MLADTWTGGDASPALDGKIRDNQRKGFGSRKERNDTPRREETSRLKGKEVREELRGLWWMEKAFLAGKLSQNELMAYESTVRTVPQQYETDCRWDDE